MTTEAYSKGYKLASIESKKGMVVLKGCYPADSVEDFEFWNGVMDFEDEKWGLDEAS